MSSETNTTTDNELDAIDVDEGAEDTDLSEEDKDSEKETDESVSEEEPGEIEESLDGELTKEEKRVQAKLEMKRSWVANITAGKKKLEDCPKWLRTDVVQEIEGGKGVDKEELQELVTKTAKELIEKEKNTQQFKDLQKSLPRLSKEQAEELKSVYGEYRTHGLSEYMALKTAAGIMGLDTDHSSAARARSAMSLPPSGRPKRTATENLDDIYKNPKLYAKWQKNKFKVNKAGNPVY